MINIVLVDDDMLALTRLKQLIDLQGVRIVGEFTKPEQALEFITKEHVDILITDMKMPVMDGIELIEKLKELKPELQLISVSSYEDFSYVKESFKLGGIDYILKHTLDEESLTKALLAAIANVKQSSKDSKAAVLEETFAEESKQALKAKLLTQLLREEIPIEEAQQKFVNYQIRLHISSTILVVCEIDDYRRITEHFSDKDTAIFLSSITDIMNRVLGNVPDKEIIRIEDGKYVLFLSFPNVRSHLFIYSTTIEFCKRLNYNLEKMLNITLSVGIGQCCSQIGDFIKSYHKCLEKLHNKFFEGKGLVYDTHQASSAVFSLNEISNKIKVDLEGIYNYLNKGDCGYTAQLEGIFEQFKARKYPKQIIELHVIDMLNIGYKVIKNTPLVEQQFEGFNQLFTQIKAVETLDETKEILTSFYQQIIQSISDRKQMNQHGYNKYTIKAIDYIKLHYKEDISLQNVADELGIHHTYLSKVFKMDAGCNFKEYLNQYRIDKAKELIRTQNYRIKEIYGCVGFNQYNYFFKVFRQVAGQTPIEYEKQIK